ncbi:hypothetical protein PTKIN_Ptkin06aG0077200 [Pterospermum kingtungense]
MLSFYEASQFRVHGEYILDEALAFSKAALESLVTKSSPNLAKRVTNALLHPWRKSIPQIDARKYITFYENDESMNETLLKFAKLDFNIVHVNT